MIDKSGILKKNILLSLIVILVAALLSALFSTLLPERKEISYTIFPSIHSQVFSVDDTNDGGNSQLVSFKSDSTISFAYTLGSSFAYPYAGIKIRLGETDTSGVDFSPFDSIALIVSSSTMDAIRVFLKEYDPRIFNPTDPTSYIYKEIEYVPGTIPNERVFSLNDFSSPAWWKIDKEITESTFLPLKRVAYIELLNGLIRSGRDTIEVEVSGIELRGSRRMLSSLLAQVLTWGIALFVVVTLLIKGYLKENRFKKRRQSMLQNSNRVELKDTSGDSATRVLHYLAQNFSDPELTLEKVARGAGVARNKVSEEIRAQLNTTFRGYLNDLRLNEASRLLANTQRRITEIALGVGFNNVSHFNRLFKQQFKQSPREYRNSAQKEGAESVQGGEMNSTP